MSPTETMSGVATVDDAACTSCGCLCDDIVLRVEGGRIIEARNACELGADGFLRHRPTEGPACFIEGRPATIAEGLDRAARILAEARYPLVCGLGDATIEAQRVAVSVADWVGACVDLAAGFSGGTTLALQQVGEVTCTLGEVRNRADLIIVWGEDPAISHPRHFGRYSLDAPGTFLPGGRGDRYAVFVDTAETQSVREAADQFIRIPRGSDFESLWILRALARGVELEPAEVESQTGVAAATWQDLMGRMKAARYGVILFGSRLADGPDGRRNTEALLSLTRDMNEHARFVCVPLGAPGNLAGAQSVLAWRTGYPFAVSLGRGYPRYGPGEFSALDLLERDEPDAVLIVSGGPTSRWPELAHAHLARVPSIALIGDDGLDPQGVTVAFRTAVYGINTPGTVYRVDGVPIPLRPAITSTWPGAEEILGEIERRVRPAAEPATEPLRDLPRCP